MTQTPYPAVKKPVAPYPQSPPKENGFGLAGFIVSIAGLFFCGIPSVIGVLLSLIGIGKQPKGFAVAGLAIGLIGMLELIIVGVLAFSAYQVGQNVSRKANNFFMEFPVMMQLGEEAQRIGAEWERLSRIPTQAEGDEMLSGRRDAMGNQIVYETDGESFTLRSAGNDKTLNTDDDLTAGPFFDIDSTKQMPGDSDFQWDETGFDPSQIEEMIKAEMEEN